MRLLIGYDGAPSGEAIFEDLTRAGLPREGEARIVAVADLLMRSPAVSEYDLHSLASRRAEMVLRQAEAHRERVIEEAKATTAEAADRLRWNLIDWKIETMVKTGTPAWELLDEADAFDADLIVVGSQERSALGRLFLGSVSKKIATDARCSVRVARAAPLRGDDPPRIIVGVDGSPAAEEAIYAVGQRVWPAETQVCLISVDDGLTPGRIAARLPQAAAMIGGYFENKEARVSSMLEWAVAELGHINLKTTVSIQKGDPQKILLEAAGKWNADSIFVGTRDFNSAFERFRLGSVSTAVATNAQCSVEIVRPPVDKTVGEDFPGGG